ncbi:hypothetical protein CC86DRAFT_368920 [Ophiobolus disseminans]|uniref:S-adenosyl-L-methionine-dependent methyltransferase n=1 Tax=Ophiobolus disseminans TaxID=1469910 RepID=A0A6A7A651_9PLEO|nr:hypothetical protein CC86DRAFT_368920 [Ophiobolus disseminans]
MVKKYNARVGELGPQHASTQAIVGDLICSTPIPSTTDDSFNLITVSAALHHFPNTEDAVQRLVERLRPGGVLFIQDIFDNGHRGSEEKKPRGFTLDELRSIMSHAGLVDFRFEVLPEDLELEVRDGEVLRINCFIARGLKREQ